MVKNNPKVLGLAKEFGIDCVPSERLRLDKDWPFDYTDVIERRVERVFETETLCGGKKRVLELSGNCPTVFKYFMDGSRRTYKVGDLKHERRYLPVIAWQVGAAVVKRTSNRYPWKRMWHSYYAFIFFSWSVTCAKPRL